MTKVDADNIYGDEPVSVDDRSNKRYGINHRIKAMNNNSSIGS
jgi:hypothetical protein